MKRLLVLILLWLPGIGTGSDLAREQRIAEQIQDAILVGEPVWLETTGQQPVRFLAIAAQAEIEPTRGGVILLHGRGANPDWTDVIHPLRSALPTHGWETVSIQLPVAAVDAPDRAWGPLIGEGLPRIDAALRYLIDRKISNVVILGHSFGAKTALAYAAGDDLPEPVVGLIVVGLSATDAETLRQLQQVSLPTLDIYGSRDLALVAQSATARRQAAMRGDNKNYRQAEIPGADHFFRGLDELLTARVRAWLDATTRQ